MSLDQDAVEAYPGDAVEVDWPEPSLSLIRGRGGAVDDDESLDPPEGFFSDSSVKHGMLVLGSQDRTRIRFARDCLIDAEDALMYAAQRDATLQPMIDAIVRMNMDLTRRADR